MLSKDEEERLEHLIKLFEIRISVNDVKEVMWLAEKLKEVNEELKQANKEIEYINKAFNWEDPCPHGYKKGDHHWYGCMGVSPFNERPTTPEDCI